MATSGEAESEPAYVSDQHALKMWSLLARFLHEGSGIVSLQKSFDADVSRVVVFPSYAGQDPDAIKPHVWMSWRHELKAPLGDHSLIRNVAEVVERFPLHSAGALAAIDHEFGLTGVAAREWFASGEPGLVALVLRVSRTNRSYKFYNLSENEGTGPFVPLPYDVDFDDSEPVLSDEDFERRLARIRAALT